MLYRFFVQGSLTVVDETSHRQDHLIFKSSNRNQIKVITVAATFNKQTQLQRKYGAVSINIGKKSTVEGVYFGRISRYRNCCQKRRIFSSICLVRAIKMVFTMQDIKSIVEKNSQPKFHIVLLDQQLKFVVFFSIYFQCRLSFLAEFHCKNGNTEPGQSEVDEATT